MSFWVLIRVALDTARPLFAFWSCSLTWSSVQAPAFRGFAISYLQFPWLGYDCPVTIYVPLPHSHNLILWLPTEM